MVDYLQRMAGVACAAAPAAVPLFAVCRAVFAVDAVLVVDSLFAYGAGQLLPAAELAAAAAMPGLVGGGSGGGAVVQSAVGTLCADVWGYPAAGAYPQPPVALFVVCGLHVAFCGHGAASPYRGGCAFWLTREVVFVDYVRMPVLSAQHCLMESGGCRWERA